MHYLGTEIHVSKNTPKLKKKKEKNTTDTAYEIQESNLKGQNTELKQTVSVNWKLLT